ncbi:hypothetical protein Hanom_Chr12g01146201 [Helianthus anomalus]
MVIGAKVIRVSHLCFVCPFDFFMPFLMFLCFTVGYSLLNVLDPKAGGAMIEAILHEGRPVWLDQIRNRFLHPSSDSFVAYANTILGEDDEDDFDDATDPTREEVIVLSSEGSDRSREGLIPHSSRAGSAQGAVNEPVNEPVDVDAELLVETAKQLETWRKMKLDKSEEKEKRVEENVTETSRKRPSTLPFLDYKRVGRDPDDSATLTKMMKKKALEDKKRKLDEQAAVALAAKRAKLQKETPPAPSESEIDMAVFTAKHGNLLKKNIRGFWFSWYNGFSFVCSSCHFLYLLLTILFVLRQVLNRVRLLARLMFRRLPPPTSPPSWTFGLSPAPVGHGKKKEDDVEIEQVGEGGAAGAGGDAGGAGGDGRGRVLIPRQSRDTHNPTCADLPHAPRWNLAQGSRMSDHDNCREFFSLSHAPAKRLFQKRNLMLRRRAYPGGLLMRSKSSHRRNNLTPISKKEWEIAYERKNKELQAQRDAIVRLSAEKTKISDEAEQERVASQKREQEYLQCIAKLEKFAEENIAESKASKLLAEEVSADCRWLLARAVPLISECIVKYDELANYMFELGQAAYNSRQKDGYGEGRAAAANNEKDYHFELYKEDCGVAYAANRREHEFIKFGIVKAVDKLSRRANVVEVLKKAIGDSGTNGGVGPSHQD